MAGLDTSVVDLLRLPSGGAALGSVEGEVYRVDDHTGAGTVLADGAPVAIGETLFVSPSATARVAGHVLRGGNNGRAYAFVAETAHRGAPSRQDVPKLLGQLEEIERRVKERLGLDPLALHEAPKSPCDRAAAMEFALLNFTPEVSDALPEGLARALGAVPLFLSDESMFIAMSTVTLAKLRRLMEALGRPVNPHLVEPAVLDELLRRAYGGVRPPVLPS